jgi:hypothetical protein
MAEIKSSAKGWIFGVVIVLLVVIGAYIFVKNRASADVITSGADYKFEVLSNKRLTVVSENSSGGNNILYRITEPIELGSGFGLRLRKKTGQIVSNVELTGTGKEGIFFQDAAKNTAGVYPMTSGAHKVWATIKVPPTNGILPKTRLVVLYFDTAVVAPPTGTPTVSATPRPSVSPIITPRPSIVGQNQPGIEILYKGQRIKMGYIPEQNSLEVKKGDEFTIVATWPQPTPASSLIYSSFCTTGPTTCHGSDYVTLTQYMGGESSIGLNAKATNTGNITILFNAPPTFNTNSFKVNITE